MLFADSTVHHDVNAYTYDDVCMSSFELHTDLPTAVHDNRTVYRYSTLADQTVLYNYTHNHHPVAVPFLCPWPVPDLVMDIKFAVKQISQF
jgi:hypothetical protein